MHKFYFNDYRDRESQILDPSIIHLRESIQKHLDMHKPVENLNQPRHTLFI